MVVPGKIADTHKFLASVCIKFAAIPSVKASHMTESESEWEGTTKLLSRRGG